MSSSRWDETWHRLREWTNGQGPSERLAAQLLLDEGFTSLDPSHPLGGRDGGKDAVASKDGLRWIVAAYFPRGQQSFEAIRTKFAGELDGARSNSADAFVFVTNQELRLSERRRLEELAGELRVELYHLERITNLLDQPAMRPVRDQFLGAFGDEAVAASITTATIRLEGLQTGGDSFCYWMLYNFDLSLSIARDFVVIRNGEFPLYDVRFRIQDMERNVEVFSQRWGEMNAAADYRHVKWQLHAEEYYRVFFHARNGSWHQDLQLRRSEPANCWLAATRLFDQTGKRLVHVDNEFASTFGDPKWRD
jgi:hypothetical protein